MYLNEKYAKELVNDYNVHRSVFIISLVSQLDDVIYDQMRKTIRLKYK